MNRNSLQFPTSKLLTWFETNKRSLPWRRSRTIYSVWVAEVMLQQTRSETVHDYYLRFLKRFPTISDLAEAPIEEVLKYWEGLGYYSRARNLHRAACLVLETFAGVIPGEPECFRSLPGVGRYIQSAVMSIACGFALPVVDGNVIRVFSRFYCLKSDTLNDSTVTLIYEQLTRIIPPDRPGDFNESLMELGALVCLPRNPRCSVCPLRNRCCALKTDKIESFPVKRPKRKIPFYEVAVGLLWKRGKFLVLKRPMSGHLGGLWEFPGGKVEPSESPPEALQRECREELNIDVVIGEKIGEVRHAYSHFSIRLHLFACKPRSGKIRSLQPFRWLGFEEVESLPFPAANHKLFPAVNAWIGRRTSALK